MKTYTASQPSSFSAPSISSHFIGVALMPSHTTHETAKNAVIFHTHLHHNIFRNCNGFSNSVIYGQWFSQRFLGKSLQFCV